MSVFSNRRVRSATPVRGNDAEADPTPKLLRNIACGHTLTNWRAYRTDYLNTPATLVRETVDKRKLYSNMNSHREVAEWAHDRVFVDYSHEYGVRGVTPSDWWIFMQNERGKVIPVNSYNNLPCPLPVTDTGTYFVQTEDYDDIPWPCIGGTKRVFQIKKYDLVPETPISSSMEWEHETLVERQVSIRRTCTRIVFWKNMKIWDNSYFAKASNKLNFVPDYIVRQVDERAITEEDYTGTWDDRDDPNFVNPKFDRPYSDDRLWPFGVTDQTRRTPAPFRATLALPHSRPVDLLHPAPQLGTETLLTGLLRNPVYETLGYGWDWSPYNYAQDVFPVSNIIDINGARLASGFMYAHEPWLHSGKYNSTWANNPWPYGVPNKHYDLVLYVNFYKYNIYHLSGGEHHFESSGFLGGYGTAFLIY